jgi:hypothetical protein
LCYILNEDCPNNNLWVACVDSEYSIVRGE